MGCSNRYNGCLSCYHRYCSVIRSCHVHTLQATVGVCNIDKPGMMDFVKKAKWDAWNSLGSLSQVGVGDY